MGDGALPTTCDVLVIGSGAGGLATAVVARAAGLDVVVVEKEALVGGTTAWSGGWIWIPGNAHAVRAGIADSRDAALAYIAAECGERFDAARIHAYLDSAPAMLDWFERHTPVRFALGRDYPDYHPSSPGASPGGRALCPVPFDGRELGAALAWLRPPVPELTLFGLKVGSGADFHHFFRARRSPRSAWYVARRVLRHAADVARHGRDVLLMSGNALAGRLLQAALASGVRLYRSAPARRLLIADRHVIGAVVESGGRAVDVLARRGVVCAAGGFPRDVRRRAAHYLEHPRDASTSLAAPGNAGDGTTLVESAGGRLDVDCASAAAYMPVSTLVRRDGTAAVYPHSYERGKPGIVAVLRDGRRFVNESDSYHDFVRAMIAAAADGARPEAFLIADQRAFDRYGLGIAKPFPLPRGRHLRSGYLARAATLAGLAAATGIDAEGLARTIAAFNRHAAAGHDPLFGRGANAYNRYQGDPAQRPNPCLAPLERPPYYAVRVVPGDLSTFMGVRTDADARVLDGAGRPVPGLHAVGTDMASIFGGCYPGPGANLGPALTFGYRCALHLAGTAAPAGDAHAAPAPLVARTGVSGMSTS